MTEKLKRLISLLCLIAMLCVVSAPVQAGGEHPWDSDQGVGTEGGSLPDSEPENDPDQGLTGVIIHIGSGGIITFVGQSFYSFIVRITGQDFTKNGNKSTRNLGNGTQS